MIAERLEEGFGPMPGIESGGSRALGIWVKAGRENRVGGETQT